MKQGTTMDSKKVLNNYKNGNYKVSIYADGTKIRYGKVDKFEPEFPESIDLKITNYCDKGCKFCHENSTIDGKHAKLDEPFLGTLRAGTELAVGGGDPLSHPDLIEFLTRMKRQGVICNITVNQQNDLGVLQTLVTCGLIYGVGISCFKYDQKVIDFAIKNPNTVLHVINGVITEEEVRQFFNKKLKILILGYKTIRRGKKYFENNSESVEKNKKDTFDNLLEIMNNFAVVSFDNLAIKQLNPSRLLSKEMYDKHYMGDDGDFTMYVDLVNKEFAVSSTREKRFALLDNIDDMFDRVRNSK